jgi:hypothetical protein
MPRQWGKIAANNLLDQCTRAEVMRPINCINTGDNAAQSTIHCKIFLAWRENDPRATRLAFDEACPIE